MSAEKLPDEFRRMPESLQVPLRPNGEPYPPAVAASFADMDAECRRAWRGSRKPIHRIVEAILARESTESEAVDQLAGMLARPSGARWNEHLVAAWTLGHAVVSGEQRSRSVELLRALLRMPAWPDTLRRSLLATLALSTAVSGFVFMRTGENPVDFWLFSSVALLPFIWLSYSISDANSLHSVQAAAVIALGRLRAASSVDEITEALHHHSGWVRRAAIAALPLVLPGLTPQDYGCLRARTIPNLCDTLNEQNVELDEAILEALAKVGDGRAIRRVEYMTRFGRTDDVRLLAERALPILRARQRREQDASRLLRPAAAPPDTGLLLRPAQGVGEADTDRLLRPADSEHP
jgi:hypothetical protein